MKTPAKLVAGAAIVAFTTVVPGAAAFGGPGDEHNVVSWDDRGKGDDGSGGSSGGRLELDDLFGRPSEPTDFEFLPDRILRWLAGHAPVEDFASDLLTRTSSSG